MKTEQRYEIIDNLKGISKLQDNSIDLTVTSPPYDNLRTYGGCSFEFEKLARELYRVTKDGGVVVWIVGDQTKDGNETGTSFKQALYFRDIGFNLLDTMIYLKDPRYPRSNAYPSSFEYMFILLKGKKNTYNPIKQPNYYRKSNSLISRQVDGTKIKDTSKNPPKEKPLVNVWYYPAGYMLSTKDKYAFDHPAVFPEQLAKDHILSWSNEGDWVLDPFLGSGTTLKMCMETNRNGIGFELNEGYDTIIKKRLKLDNVKLDAFDDRNCQSPSGT